MESKITTYQTECSPSHLPNNLTSSNISLFFIHNSESQPRVSVINTKLFSSELQPSTFISNFNTSETNEMLCLKAVNLNSIYHLAIGLYGGLKIWSIDGNRLLFQIPAKVKIEERPYAFISLCEFQMLLNSQGYDSLLAHDNYGQLFIVHGQGSNWKSKVILTTPKESGISMAGYMGSFFVGVCYDSNTISLLKLENGKCDQLISFKDDNIALTSCVVNSKSCLHYTVGLINGEVKMYNFTSLSLEYSIASHARLVNCVISLSDNTFVSGSDDGYVNVWKIHDNQIVNKGNYSFEDKTISGISYNKETNSLYVNCYDMPEIHVINNMTD